MKRAALVTVAIFMLAATLFAVPKVIDGQTTGTIDQTWVNQHLAEWAPTSAGTVNFGMMFTRASYNNILQTSSTPQVLNSELAMLVSSGAQYVRIDIGYDAWLKNNTAAQSEVSSLVSQIRSDGKSLVIADAAAESYRSSPLTWDQFTSAWVQRVTTLATLYHPAYYIVVKEPGWYAPMISNFPAYSTTGEAQWVALVQQLVQAVQTASPSTKIGVAVDAGGGMTNHPQFYTQLLADVEKVSGVSFIGFDIYGTNGFTNTQNFLSATGAGGKAVWIAECWSTASVSSVFDPSRATLDAGWARVVYYFALYEKASVVIPFYTNALASYSMSTSLSDPTQIVSLYQQRTPAFYSFQADINGSALSIATSTSTSTVSTTASSSSTSTVSTTSGGTTATQSSGSTTSHTTQTTSSTQPGTRLLGVPLLGIALVAVLVLVVVIYALVRPKRH